MSTSSLSPTVETIELSLCSIGEQFSTLRIVNPEGVFLPNPSKRWNSGSSIPC